MFHITPAQLTEFTLDGLSALVLLVDLVAFLKCKFFLRRITKERHIDVIGVIALMSVLGSLVATLSYIFDPLWNYTDGGRGVAIFYGCLMIAVTITVFLMVVGPALKKLDKNDQETATQMLHRSHRNLLTMTALLILFSVGHHTIF